MDPVKRKASTLKFKQKNPNYLKEWRVKNRERDRELNREYVKNRYKTDILYRLKMILRHRLNVALKRKKSQTLKQYLGCSVEELKIHLKSKFLEGMNWINYGDWHIDHIIPLNSAQTEEDLYKLCHYSNLQPLWALDNLKKGSKYVV